jgi:hypothetical protein
MARPRTTEDRKQDIMNLDVTNFSKISLFTTGMQGDEIVGFKVGQRIEPTPTLVATFKPSGSDSWGWIDLGTNPGEKSYQIYFERHHSTMYAFFGYYDASRSQENGNPSPFPDGVASAVVVGDDIHYTLYRKP